MNKSKLLIALVMISLIGVFYSYDLQQYLDLSYLKSQQNALHQYYLDNPAKMIGGFALVYVISTSLSLPGAALLTLLAGAIFGLLAGTIIVSFASTIAQPWHF